MSLGYLDSDSDYDIFGDDGDLDLGGGLGDDDVEPLDLFLNDDKEDSDDDGLFGGKAGGSLGLDLGLGTKSKADDVSGGAAGGGGGGFVDALFNKAEKKLEQQEKTD